MFQFHKVQLKVTDATAAAADAAEFQFHKVQLKGGGAHDRRRDEGGFNSIRYN